MSTAGYELHIRSLWRLGERICNASFCLALAIYHTRDRARWSWASPRWYCVSQSRELSMTEQGVRAHKSRSGYRVKKKKAAKSSHDEASPSLLTDAGAI